MPLELCLHPEINVSDRAEEIVASKARPIGRGLKLPPQGAVFPSTQRVFRPTYRCLGSNTIPFNVSDIPMGARLPFDLPKGRTQMQNVISLLTVIGGLALSVAVAVVVEELIFGQLLRVFLVPLSLRIKAEQGRR
jgi:hypothetical protein